MIELAPGSSSSLAKLMKGEEKVNELAGKIKFLFKTLFLIFFFFLWYFLNRGGNGEIICRFLDSWLWLFGSLFPWTSLGKNWAFTIKAK